MIAINRNTLGVSTAMAVKNAALIQQLRNEIMMLQIQLNMAGGNSQTYTQNIVNQINAKLRQISELSGVDFTPYVPPNYNNPTPGNPGNPVVPVSPPVNPHGNVSTPNMPNESGFSSGIMDYINNNAVIIGGVVIIAAVFLARRK